MAARKVRKMCRCEKSVTCTPPPAQRSRSGSRHIPQAPGPRQGSPGDRARGAPAPSMQKYRTFEGSMKAVCCDERAVLAPLCI